jgi:hypothetical protein
VRSRRSPASRGVRPAIEFGKVARTKGPVGPQLLLGSRGEEPATGPSRALACAESVWRQRPRDGQGQAVSEEASLAPAGRGGGPRATIP